MTRPSPTWSLLVVCCILQVFAAPPASADACPADGRSPCAETAFCVGMNTGFLGARNRDFAFIDLMRGAHVSLPEFEPADIASNASIPLDRNKYPTSTGIDVEVLFYSNRKTGKPYATLPSGRYVVLWDGVAAEADVVGSGVTGVLRSENRIAFSMDTLFDSLAMFRYQNVAGEQHAHNIRIVPIAYERHYRDWSWTKYGIGVSTNPPIFFPSWLEKMSSACTVRYMNARQTNDRHVVEYERDSNQSRIRPSFSVWYEGFNLGDDVLSRHVWPWELIVESTLQTKTIPWINFRVLAFENILAGDSLVERVARLFYRHYGEKIYVEYGNEIWNYGWPFTVASEYVEKNGPGFNDDINENYTLRSNLIQKTFADAYGNSSCLAIGVLGTQASNPWNGGQRMRHADLDYIDMLSPAAYVGDNAHPEAEVWPFLTSVYQRLDSELISETRAFRVIKDELLSGRRGAMQNSWDAKVGPSMRAHAEIADEYGVCLGFYESGFHMRVDQIDYRNLEHLGIADMVRRYRKSVAQRDVEKQIYEEMAGISSGPIVPYASVSSAGNGAFAYWESIFAESSNDDPRARLIRDYNDSRRVGRERLVDTRRLLRELEPAAFRSTKARAAVFRKLRAVQVALEARQGRRARALTMTLPRIVNGCGRTPDRDDLVVDCDAQRKVRRKFKSLNAAMAVLPATPTDR